MSELQRSIDAERSDLYDVLEYVAYARPTITREERIAASRASIEAIYRDEQREFLDFVLSHYVKQGVDELDQSKLPHLLELKNHGIKDAVQALGDVAEIREVFVGFQELLYPPRTLA